MANESFALSFTAPPRLERTTLASIAFFALLILVFVGFQPFIPPSPGTPLAASDAGQGDLIHQILYLGVFAVILLTAVQRRGLGAARALPFVLGLLQLWCLLSAIWAAEHGIAFRRATLEVVLTLSVLLSADTIGPERAFRYWRIVLAGVLVVNWISIPLIHTAVHLPGEVDPGLVGDWRGLYGQKNAAGATCAMTALLFLFTRNGRYNWIGWLVAAASLGFLVMTRSKTSLALFPVALLAGLAYRACWRDGLSRSVFVSAAALLVLVAGAAGIFYADAISRVLEDPTEFTGRAEIWQAYIAFVRDHPWLGAGFGTLYSTGGLSPMHNYVRSAWVEATGDSHDGYLQLLVTLGGVGFVLGMVSLVLEPLAGFWPLDYQQTGFKALLFALFVFFVLHNFLESDFLTRDSGVWFSLLLVIAALRNPDKSLTLAP
jgi:exopolysaccharide production protein ExoQ